ncbi:MAG: 1-acyl-sn-glycerol-3-phosphate acyltransferase [Frankiaceae bacterium]
MTPGQLLRRAVVVPVVLAVEVTLVATSPVLLPLAALGSVASRRRLPLRTAALVVAYALIELRALGELAGLHRHGRARDQEAAYALARRFLDRLARAVDRTLGVRVELATGSATGDDVRAATPLVVLSRHAGPGDSFLLAWLLLSQWRVRPRIVLRTAMRLEPGVELVLSRLPSCFVRPGAGRRTKAAITDAAAGMGTGDAMLLFPEGGNFTEERRRVRIARLLHRRTFARARQARRMRHVLAPYPGGALAALAGAPDADVLVIAHSGLGGGSGERRWWSLPVDRDLVVHARLVPRSEIPASPADLERWLYAQWRLVDDWVDRWVRTEAQSFSSGA